MTIASFEHLCAGICEIVGMTVPRLEPDDFGVVAFHFQLRDVTVNVAYRPNASEERVFIVIEFGVLMRDDPLIAQRMRSLLDANFNLMRSDTPIFACHPDTGDVVMQCAYTLAEATPADLFELIDDCVDEAWNWRRDDIFGGPPATLLGADFA
jgi:hypothetical protein